MAGWQDLLDLVTGEGKQLIRRTDIEHTSLPLETKLDQWVTMRRSTDFYWDKMLGGFDEIEASFQALKDIAVYVGSFPHRNSQVTELRCLKYHVQNYLQEAYILKERLLACLTTIERALRNDKRSSQTRSKSEQLREVIKLTFKPIVDIRSHHVHQRRFEPAGMDILDEFDLLRTNPRMNKIKHVSDDFDRACRLARSQCRQTMVAQNRKIVAVLDAYADTMIRILFDPNTQRLVYPLRIK